MKRPGGFDDSDVGWEPAAANAAEADIVPMDRESPPALTTDVVDAVNAVGVVDAVDVADAADRVRSAEHRLKRAQRSLRDRERRERRRFTAHLRRRRRYWLIGFGAVGALALFVGIGVLSPLTAVREVRIIGASQVNADEVTAALAKFDGVPLALVDDGEVHRALEPFPLIQRYSIERIPPHTLQVRIEERDAVIALQGDGAFELRDPAGVLVGTATELPAGVPLATAAVASPGTAAFEAAGLVIRDLPEDLRSQLAGVSATSAQDVTFTLANGTQVVWGESSDTQRKAVVLRSMLAAVGAVAVIDVSAPQTPVFR